MPQSDYLDNKINTLAATNGDINKQLIQGLEVVDSTAIHTTGNEDITGIKTFISDIISKNRIKFVSNDLMNTNNWHESAIEWHDNNTRVSLIQHRYLSDSNEFHIHVTDPTTPNYEYSCIFSSTANIVTNYRCFYLVNANWNCFINKRPDIDITDILNTSTRWTGFGQIQDKNSNCLSSIDLQILNGWCDLHVNVNAYSVTHDLVISAKQDSTNRNIRSNSDNLCDLGASSHRWKQIFAGTATISTSDERHKDNINNIPNEVLDAWDEIQWSKYQFKDAIKDKGNGARYHTGLIAQRILEVFTRHNLDATRYGLLCHDSWDAIPEEKDHSGRIVQEARPAGDLYSLRYEECLAVEAAYQRRKVAQLESTIQDLVARIEKLENK